jgi:hypothetical protein
MSKPLHPTKSAEEKPAEQATEVEKSEEQAPEVAPEAEETIPTNGKVEETEMPDIPIPATENGSATPQQGTENGESTSAALESTPAFGQDEIR